MATALERGILTLNAGSSSLKLGLFEAKGTLRAVFRHGIPRVDWSEAGSARALEAVFAAVEEHGGMGGVVAVGHRVVHGGPQYTEARRVTPEMLGELRRLSPLDPDHLPAEIALIEAMRVRAPALPQVACFDTAFHRTMPRVARILPIPRRYEAQGIRRYGFHGLSYTFLIEELARVAGERCARGRVVLAHLGSGASLAALSEGACVDTTMGFTPNSGVAMGTRSGDIDPGVVVQLLREGQLGPDAVDDLLSRRSGLLGISETSSDMRDLLGREGTDERASDAIALFCYGVRKAIGALAAVLGGVESLVFSGGIGENVPSVRARIVEGLEHLGVRLDAARNEAASPVISEDGSACTVRVIRTDEESILARETLRVTGGLT